MAQDLTRPACTWEHVKAECDALDQMATATVLKACDIGDMLRELRRGMGLESFCAHCAQKLNRGRQWADKLIVLSFRRDAVLRALAEGEANDSIRSAYEYVKTLPAPETEQAERQQWPRKKRGPDKGSGGRPAAPATVHDQAPEPTVPDEPLSPEVKAQIEAMNEELAARILESAAIQAEVAERIKANRQSDNIERKHERADHLALDVLSMLRNANDELDVRGADLVDLFQERHVDEIKTLCLRIAALVGAVLSKTAQEKLETAIRVHKRLADREFDERVRAEVTRRLDEDVLPTYAEEYERYKALNDAWRGVFSHQEYKTLKGFLHPDRHPNEPDKAARLFRMVNEKEEILCGIKESVKNSRPATLPKTVAELMKRRQAGSK